MTTIQELIDGYNSLPEEGRILFQNQTGLMVIPKIQTIYERRMQFGFIARTRKIPLSYDNELGTDDNINDWHPKAKISNLPIPKGSYKMADGVKREKEFLAEAEANDLVFPNLDLAMQKHTIDLEAGVFDKLETYRCIFYKEGYKVRKLWCTRYPGGILRLYVQMLYLEDVRSAVSYFFCSNNENQDI